MKVTFVIDTESKQDREQAKALVDLINTFSAASNICSVSPKQEVAKQEVAKQEVAKQEVAKQEVAKQEVAKQEVAKQPEAKQPEATSSVSKEDIRAVLLVKRNEGKMDRIKSSFATYGAKNLDELDTTKYDDFINHVNKL